MSAPPSWETANVQKTVAVAKLPLARNESVKHDAAGVIGLLVALPMRHWFNPSVNFLQELMIWVKPEQRQSGAGKALVSAFEEWAALKGFSMTALSSSGVYYRKHMAKFCAGRGYRIESTIFLRGEKCRQ